MSRRQASSDATAAQGMEHVSLHAQQDATSISSTRKRQVCHNVMFMASHHSLARADEPHKLHRALGLLVQTVAPAAKVAVISHLHTHPVLTVSAAPAGHMHIMLRVRYL